MKHTSVIAATALVAIGALIAPAAAAQTQNHRENDRGTNATCESIIHVGDSLSVGMKQAGIEELYTDILDNNDGDENNDQAASRVSYSAVSGQALIEKTKGESGIDVIQRLTSTLNEDNEACLVIAFGTNDANNIAHGSAVDARKRIGAALDAAAPVRHIFWVTPAVAENHAIDRTVNQFSRELSRAAELNDLNLIRWNEEVETDLYATDGIHLTSDGYATMANFVAEAVAEGGRNQRLTANEIIDSLKHLSPQERNKVEKELERLRGK